MVVRPCALRVGGDEFIAPDMAYPVGVGLLHYHLLLCFDGISGDLLKAQLRDGTHYCSKDADQFMIPLLQEYRTKYPSLPLYLRGDSGFASPYLCQASEDNDCKYAIRLKINKTLLALAKDKADDLRRATKDNMVDYAVTFGEFEYQAGSWPRPRRMVFKIEKSAGQSVFMYTFVVTTMESAPYQIIRFTAGVEKWKTSSRKARKVLLFQMSAADQKSSMPTGFSCMCLSITCSIGFVV